MDSNMDAVMQGIGSGMQQGGSITPNAAQPQGAPSPESIICGSLKQLVDHLNQYGSLLNKQGLTALANDLYKSSMQVNVVCEKLEKEATGAGQQQ